MSDPKKDYQKPQLMRIHLGNESINKDVRAVIDRSLRRSTLLYERRRLNGSYSELYEWGLYELRDAENYVRRRFQDCVVSDHEHLQQLQSDAPIDTARKVRSLLATLLRDAANRIISDPEARHNP